MEENQSYYMVIPAPIWSAEITAKAMILYGHVSVLAKKEGYCFANNKYFEKVMKISTSTVQRCFVELEDNGLITRELIYKENSKEVETRKIYIFEHTPIFKTNHRPIIKNEHRSIIKDEQDNSTRVNKRTTNKTSKLIQQEADPLMQYIKILKNDE
jgi:predicted transcriptional regulator